MNQSIDKYKDIIHLPHHQSATRPHMSMEDRAAQFAPFATLSGHEEAILETERLTDEWSAPSEEETRILNEQAALLSERLALGERPSVMITYFQPDEKKSGGSYITYSGQLRRIDPIAGLFTMADDIQIDMNRIRALNTVSS